MGLWYRLPIQRPAPRGCARRSRVPSRSPADSPTSSDRLGAHAVDPARERPGGDRFSPRRRRRHSRSVHGASRALARSPGSQTRKSLYRGSSSLWRRRDGLNVAGRHRVDPHGPLPCYPSRAETSIYLITTYYTMIGVVRDSRNDRPRCATAGSNSEAPVHQSKAPNDAADNSALAARMSAIAANTGCDFMCRTPVGHRHASAEL